MTANARTWPRTRRAYTRRVRTDGKSPHALRAGWQRFTPHLTLVGAYFNFGTRRPHRLLLDWHGAWAVIANPEHRGVPARVEHALAVTERWAPLTDEAAGEQRASVFTLSFKRVGETATYRCESCPLCAPWRFPGNVGRRSPA